MKKIIYRSSSLSWTIIHCNFSKWPRQLRKDLLCTNSLYLILHKVQGVFLNEHKFQNGAKKGVEQLKVFDLAMPEAFLTSLLVSFFSNEYLRGVYD